jgi:hypothetical protein
MALDCPYNSGINHEDFKSVTHELKGREEIKMTFYSCKKCRAEIADTSISPTVLKQEIWNHFYSFHKEDMDATQVFSDYLSVEE